MFKEITVKLPVKNRRPVFGVGTNDAPYKTHIKTNGNRFECPFYSKWQGMLKRAYYQPYKERNPTYKDVSVCDEWLIFSNFKKWMKTQDWEGNELDKDLLVQGNKHYSPELCLFISHKINNLVASCSISNGKLKSGVVARKDNAKNSFAASCSDKGRQKHLGYYNNEDDAHDAYVKYKYKIIHSEAMKQDEPIRSALLSIKIPT